MLSKFKGTQSFLFISLFSLLLMCILFFMHKRSTNSIRELQNGNELAGQTFQINNALQDIVDNINTVENNFRNQIYKNAAGDTVNTGEVISKMNQNMLMITNLTKKTRNKENIIRLGELIKNKTTFFNTISAAIINNQNAKEILLSSNNNVLNDSIYVTALSVQIQAENELQQEITQNFAVSKQALFISKALTLLAISAILILGTIIILHLLRNNRLINELELSREKADKAANIKEQFLANMSHEIRTPVNSIIGFTNLLQKTNLVNDQQQFVSYIKTSGENLLHIINDILDISKIDAGMMHFQKEVFNLKDVCYYTEMMFYNDCKNKKINFKYTIENNVPDNIIGDEDRLKQILTNLIGNSIKFTHKGFINLTISVDESNTNLPELIFKVSDSGIGIPKNKLNTIFERFEQADNKTTKIYGGTGLGLSIVKKLITLQGGKISVESELDKGSVFTFSIPFQLPAANYPVQKEKRNQEVTEPATEINFSPGHKILVAEDNKLNQLLLQYMFKQWNLNFTIAQNGQEVIDLLNKEIFDLVLMDIQMPVMDGYSAAKWIRTELKSNIPIIAMTAYVLQSEKDKCFTYGMNEYFPKPINEVKLKQLLAKYLTNNTPINTTPYISLNYLNEMFGGKPQFISSILKLFIKQYPEDLEHLNKAIENKDIKQVKAIAHNLKSTTSSVNNKAPQLEELQKLEELCLEKPDWDMVNTNVRELKKSEQSAINEANEILKHISLYN